MPAKSLLILVLTATGLLAQKVEPEEEPETGTIIKADLKKEDGPFTIGMTYSTITNKFDSFHNIWTDGTLR